MFLVYVKLFGEPRERNLILIGMGLKTTVRRDSIKIRVWQVNPVKMSDTLNLIPYFMSNSVLRLKHMFLEDFTAS